MIKSTQRHFRTELLAHRNKANSDHRNGLVRVVLFEMVAARVQHLLHFQHVARTCVGAALHHERRELAMCAWEGLECLEREVCGALLAEIEETKSKNEEASVCVAEGGFIALEECLQDVRKKDIRKKKSRNKPG